MVALIEAPQLPPGPGAGGGRSLLLLETLHVLTGPDHRVSDVGPELIRLGVGHHRLGGGGGGEQDGRQAELRDHRRALAKTKW
jgi:hypothetical protein